jgi:hypothetical protein
MGLFRLLRALRARAGASIGRRTSWRKKWLFAAALTASLAGGTWIAQAASSVNVGDPATVDGQNGTVVSVFGANRYVVVDLGATATPTPTPTPSASPTATPTASGSACTSVSSLSAARSAVAAGHNACLVDGSYSGGLTLSAPAGWSAAPLTVSAVHPLAAHVSGTITLDSHTGISGLDVTSSSDCVSIPVGQTTISVAHSRLHDCGRDGIRWARPALNGSNETKNVLVQANEIANTHWNSLTVRGNHSTIIDNNMHGSTNDAIVAWGDSNSFIHNHIHDYSNSAGNHDDGLQTWGGGDDGFRGTPLTHLLFERNTVESILGSNAHGLMMSSWGSGTVRRNVFRNIGSYAADFYFGENINMLSNTFVNTGKVIYGSSTAGSSTGSLMANIFGPGTGAYSIHGTVTRDYNLASDWTPAETHGLHANPQFDSSTNLHLQATSPARNTGDPNITTTDLDGINPVGTPDRGAYEYR